MLCSVKAPLTAATFILLAASVFAPVTGEAQLLREPRAESRAGSLMKMPSLVFLDSVMRITRRQVGTRYTYGGERPAGGFDCSGLVRYVMQVANLQLPRNSAEQARLGHAVPREVNKLRVGDLLTFGDGGRVSHVGIYVGSGRFVHASSVSGRVVESLVERAPARGIKPWLGVRRLALQEPAIRR